jgi:hypothetical protein
MTRLPCTCTVSVDCPGHGAFAGLNPTPVGLPRETLERMLATSLELLDVAYREGVIFNFTKVEQHLTSSDVRTFLAGRK